MTEAATTARNHFAGGYNCAQAVFLTFCEELGLDLPTGARLTNCLGGGCSQTGGLCGALAGGCLAVSAAFGRDEPSRTGQALARQEKTYRLVQQLHARFVQEFGATDCPALLEHSFAASGAAADQKHLCPQYVARAAEWTAQVLAEESERDT